MRRVVPTTLDDRNAQQPLRITVTAAGRENLVLRALVRQAIPMLQRPEGYSRAERCQLAQTLSFAVGSNGQGGQEEYPPEPCDSDAPPERDLDAYEPGCQLEYDD